MIALVRVHCNSNFSASREGIQNALRASSLNGPGRSIDDLVPKRAKTDAVRAGLSYALELSGAMAYQDKRLTLVRAEAKTARAGDVRLDVHFKEIGKAVNYLPVGSSTTQFDITNTAGTTYRYTFDGTGTDPNFSLVNNPIGSLVYFNAQNFTAANNGFFIVTGAGANYVEVTNASGVAENNKTIGSGTVVVSGTAVKLATGTSKALMVACASPASAYTD